MQEIKMEIKELCKEAHRIAKEHGFWEEGTNRNIGESIALMHSELSEAFEDYREHGFRYIEHSDGKPDGFCVELADCIIRIADFCQAFGINIEKNIIKKMEYNKTRPYKHNKIC
jgi:NTP pyrophosphatase (non-canonical NTP hydrolase)